jgi:hypothetical protein
MFDARNLTVEAMEDVAAFNVVFPAMYRPWVIVNLQLTTVPKISKRSARTPDGKGMVVFGMVLPEC